MNIEVNYIEPYALSHTAYEHLLEFEVINITERIYDPIIGRFLSPDNYIQAPDFTQSLNRYSYCINNPLKYTDPSGEIIFTVIGALLAPVTGGASLAIGIGMDIGMWSGGTLANGGEMNPFKWDYSSGKTWGYMAGGAAIGAASGYVGGAIAAEGGFMANTMGIMAASHVNSVGMEILSGGQTDYTLSFGVASYNFTKGEWGYLGKPVNSALENVGYGLGALANLGDLHGIYSSYKAAQYAATKGTPIDVPENFDPNAAWEVLGTKEGYNYYGPSKTGWDPEMIRSQLKVAPVKGSNLDELAYIHDIVHYNNGTEGLSASILSTNKPTILSDFALAKGAVSVLRSGVTGNVARTALSTSIGMYFLGGMHTMSAYSYYWPMMYNY